MAIKEFSLEEIEEIQTHNDPTDLWVIVDGKVYDITKWIPNADDAYVRAYAGGDATEAVLRNRKPGFLERHQQYLYLKGHIPLKERSGDFVVKDSPAASTNGIYQKSGRTCNSLPTWAKRAEAGVEEMVLYSTKGGRWAIHKRDFAHDDSYKGLICSEVHGGKSMPHECPWGTVPDGPGGAGRKFQVNVKVKVQLQVNAEPPTPDVKAEPRPAQRPAPDDTDLMAQEGEVSRLPLVIGLVVLAVLAWSGLAGFWARCHYLTVPAFYLAGVAAYYGWHRIAHEHCSGTIYEVQRRYYHVTFPPTDFYGDAAYAGMYPDGKPTIWSLMKIWRSVNTRDQAIYFSPLIAFMLAILLCGYFVCRCSGPTLLFAFIMYATLAIVGNAFRMSFHVRGFHLEKYEWYKQLRMVHYMHHCSVCYHGRTMKTDFTMVSMLFDWLLRSLRVRDPARPGISQALLRGGDVEPVVSI